MAARSLEAEYRILKEYVSRCEYELLRFRQKLGDLPLTDDERAHIPPTATKFDGLPPLMQVYDERIRELELMLESYSATQQEKEKLAERNGQLLKDNEQMLLQLDSEMAKVADLAAKYGQVHTAAEQYKDRAQLLSEENKRLLQAQKDLNMSLERTQERLRVVESDAHVQAEQSAVLQQSLAVLQGKEASTARRLNEAVDEAQKLRVENLSVKRMLESEQQKARLLQAQEEQTERQMKEALDEADNVRRDNKRLTKELEASRQAVAQLQQAEFDALRQLKESIEQLEECKVDVSSSMMREREKDGQLSSLRDQMKQLLDVHNETNARHMKLVSEQHRKQLDELREEVKAKEMELSTMKAQMEKALWERKLVERELEIFRRDPLGVTLDGAMLNASAGAGAAMGTLTLNRTGGGGTVSSAGGGGGGAAASAAGNYVDDLQSQLHRCMIERDELSRRLDAETQRHKREAREKELESEQSKNQLALRDRKIHKLETDLSDLREELQGAQKEVDKLAKQLQTTRLAKEESERRAEYETNSVASKAKLDVERLRLQLEDTTAKLVNAESALAKATSSFDDKERRWRVELQRERERLEHSGVALREDTAALERDCRELRAQLAGAARQLREREVEAEESQLKITQLTKAVDVHKAQLAATTDKLTQLLDRECKLRVQLKECELVSSRERLERERLGKDVARLRSEVTHYRQLLFQQQQQQLLPGGGMGVDDGLLQLEGGTIHLPQISEFDCLPGSSGKRHPHYHHRRHYPSHRSSSHYHSASVTAAAEPHAAVSAADATSD